MNHKEQAHQFMQSYLDAKSRVVDMTCGNGHDTLFLAQHANHVFAIDIQAQAISSTKEKTKDCDNVTLIHNDHASVDYKKIAPLNGAIYNLGYLPHSDKTVITTAASTTTSLERLLPFLTDFLVIACYRGHEGGNDEYEAVKAFVSNHNLKATVLSYETPLSPVTFLIDLKHNQE